MKLRWPKYQKMSKRFSPKENTTETKNATNVFRRNRTLVGSLSSSVLSTNELGGSLLSPRARTHHLFAQRHRLLTVLVYVFVVSLSLVWMLYQLTSSIDIGIGTTTYSLGRGPIDTSRYSKEINEYLNNHPLERLRPLLNNKELTNYLAAKTPEVSRIFAKGSSGVARTRFEIQFRKPVAGWFIDGKQYYVDKEGVSFLLNYYERPVVKIIDNSGVPRTSGSTVISGRFLRFVGRTVDVAKGMVINIEKASIPPGTTRQVDVNIVGRPYTVKLSLDRPVGEQVEDMSRTLNFLNERKLEPSYIDLRVSGRAYYKN